MTPKSESELSKLNPPSLRCAEAERFLELYVESCGPPADSYFNMICFVDAFLFALTSVEEMLDSALRHRLCAIPAFHFIKNLRNFTTHHAVIAAAAPSAKFGRPFSREVGNDVGEVELAYSRLFFNFPVLHSVIDAVELERSTYMKNAKREFDRVRAFASQLESSSSRVYLKDVMEDALSATRAAI